MSILIAPRLLTKTQLSEYISIGKTMICYMQNPKRPEYDPDFPKPLKNGTSHLYLKEEVDVWIDKFVKKQRSQSNKQSNQSV
jgi:predicted DNA-binding transcriptional regulator AlpA